MSDLSNLGPGSDELHDRARRRDEELRRRIEQGGIPVDHGIREEITPEQREEWAERTRRHADEEDKIIDKMRGRTPPTTKSFSGLLKSLRAKYGIKTASQETELPEQDASAQESSSQDILSGEGWEPLPDYAVKARMQRYDREPNTGRTIRQWYSDRRGSLPMEDQSHLSEANDLITNFLVGPGKNPNAPYQTDLVEDPIPRESGPKGPIFGYLMDTVRNDSPERLERIAERDDVSTPLPSPEEQYSSLMYLPKVPIVRQPQRPAGLRQPHPNEIEDDVVKDDTDHPQEDDYKFYVPHNYGIKSVTSDDGEELEDDPRDWEEFDKSQGKDGQEDQSKISEMVSEKSYSSQVPIPHGNLSKTNIPPVEWEPGVGAKNYVDPSDSVPDDLPDEEDHLSDEERQIVQREDSTLDDIAQNAKFRGNPGQQWAFTPASQLRYKSISELASFFKAMSDEKAFGQVHREKALELLQKAVPYNLLHQGQQTEDPRINRVYSTMPEGEPAFDPNPAGPPAPERTPTQEEIWQQVVEEERKRGREPAFHPTDDENIPYAEPHREPAFVFPEQKAFKVGDRVQEVGSNPKNPRVDGKRGVVTYVPKGNNQDSTVDYQMDDGDFTVSARANQLCKTPAKALSVLNSFLKDFSFCQ